nr:MAG TPA: hypothetical protein [Caudoviricetes sp.]
MQKFKLRNKDLDTLMEIYRNSSMIFIKINQLTLHQFFYAHISQEAMERNEPIPVREANNMTSRVLFWMLARDFLYFFKNIDEEWE